MICTYILCFLRLSLSLCRTRSRSSPSPGGCSTDRVVEELLDQQGLQAQEDRPARLLQTEMELGERMALDVSFFWESIGSRSPAMPTRA